MTEPTPLEVLAEAFGVTTTYVDVMGVSHRARPEALLRVLRSVGAPVERMADAAPALRARRIATWREVLPPVSVAWVGDQAALALRLPAAAAGVVRCELRPHGVAAQAEPRTVTGDLAALPVTETAEVGGERFATRRLALGHELPAGYWGIRLETPGATAEGLLIVAPRLAAPAARYWPSGRTWGAYLPLWALPTERGLGVANLTDLGELMAWIGELGGDVVGTLPLSAAFLGEPFEPSPYAPASRLFWNEAYLDVALAPELALSADARDTLERTTAVVAAAGLNATPEVDWRWAYACQRRVLMELSHAFFAGGGPGLPDFDRFLALYPRVEDYARFRAATGARRRSWHSWSEPSRGGRLSTGDWDEDERRYHVYAQLLAHRQLSALGERGRGRGGVGLYTDLPLGAHPDSYDVWRWQDVFALDMSLGAPPDLVFSGGQTWGLPPLVPDRLAQTGYAYFIESVRAQMRYATIMRIDHVMGLHRQLWVPSGGNAGDGVYVRQDAEALYAIVCLESVREGCVVIGEDLGTVPDEVREAMAAHGLQRMYVAQLELGPERGEAIPRVPAGAVVSVNTHDMPPFAAWWDGLDIEDRAELGLYDASDQLAEHALRRAVCATLVAALGRVGAIDPRTAGVGEVLRALHELLAAGPAGTLLVNLEDLWLETWPQNVPGTWRERPNWVRRARRGLAALRGDAEVLAALAAIARLRAGGRGGDGRGGGR